MHANRCKVEQYQRVALILEDVWTDKVPLPKLEKEEEVYVGRGLEATKDNYTVKFMVQGVVGRFEEYKRRRGNQEDLVKDDLVRWST